MSEPRYAILLDDGWHPVRAGDRSVMLGPYTPKEPIGERDAAARDALRSAFNQFLEHATVTIRRDEEEPESFRVVGFRTDYNDMPQRLTYTATLERPPVPPEGGSR